METMLAAARERTEGADLIELRVDALEAPPELERLRELGDKPLILTCRCRSQGGLFAGSEKERIAVLTRALEIGFDYVDIELESATPELLGHRDRSKVVLSHHGIDTPVVDVPKLIERAIGWRPEVIKIASRVDSLCEALELFEAGQVVRECGLQWAPVALGRAGTAARILTAPLGGDLAYATARGLPPAGPGQVGLEALLDDYGFRTITSRTRIYGILGHPVLESLSPAMHNAWFHRQKLDAVYVPFEESDAERFCRAARRLPLGGLSVTRPHKSTLLPFLDELDDATRTLGAVNTVVVEDGRWRGVNTDVIGVIEPIARHGAVRGKRAVVLGAGGAARAAAFGLHAEGAEVTILARRVERARELARVVKGKAGALDTLPRTRWDILVNATPVGGGELAGELPAPLGGVPRGAIVLDMVYLPGRSELVDETELLRAARRAGAKTVSGLEMLVAQALPQAELWTGRRPPPELLAGAARRELERRRIPENDEGRHGRYSRQILFSPIGPAGQERIRRSRVLVVGVGALGSVSAEMLARAGVGTLRIVDRDFLDESNLQRQSLYDEEDLKQSLPKAVAAAEKLRRMNHDVTVEARVDDVDAGNVGELVSDVDLILDGTDNFETRYLLNDACVKWERPWIYAACVGSYGMSFLIRPRVTPCLRCFLDSPPAPGTSPTCDTAGVIAPVVHAVAAFQVAEALKVLTGREEALADAVMTLDVWTGRFDRFRTRGPRPDCPTCGRARFEFLEGGVGRRTATLCGRNAVQIRPGTSAAIDLQGLGERLRAVGEVHVNPYLLRFRSGGKEIVLFGDGRAIVHGTDDAAEARSLYARYVGA